MNLLSRFGLLGDIHAEHQRLATALAVLRSQCSVVLGVGDVVDGPGDVDATIALLREHRVELVRGNHDRWALGGEMRRVPHATERLSEGARTYLEALPATRHYTTVRGSLLLCHGVADDDMAGVRPDDVGYALANNYALRELMRSGEHALVACGHTHQKMVRTIGPLTLLNAGTLHREHDPGFFVVDLERGLVDDYVLPSADRAEQRPSIPLG